MSCLEDQVVRVETPLTAREEELLRLFGEGKNYKEVASAMGIAASTTDAHKRNIVSKMGPRARRVTFVWLATIYREHGLTELRKRLEDGR